MALPRVVTSLHLPPAQLAILREHCEVSPFLSLSFSSNIVIDGQVILPRSQWPIPKEELHELVAGAEVGGLRHLSTFDHHNLFLLSDIWYLSSGISGLLAGARVV